MEKEFPGTGTGLIIGKFMPPHAGHRYLVDFAINYVEKLTVLVCTLETEPIPGELRYKWMARMFPGVQVLHVTENLPQEPHEHPDFWNIWKDAINRAAPQSHDYLFASEDYGFRLAQTIGAEYVPVDHARAVVPVSGTAIRENPYANWRYLPSIMRPYFVRRVCVYGNECTGKSTLARQLAEHYETVCVDEYARGLLDFSEGKFGPEDIIRIAKGHMASEDALAFQANKVMFCDTDLITTAIWSDVFFGNCPQWIRDEADRRQYDLYLLTDIDIPFVEDPQRYKPDERRKYHERFRDELSSRGRRYVTVGGSRQERFDKARTAVDELLASPWAPPVSPRA